MLTNQLVKDLGDALLEKRDIISWLRLYSVQVWNKIGFVRQRKRMRIDETTITQSLVFDFWQLASITQIPVEIYESKDEKSNGADLEIVIETDKGFIILACQAKILNAKSEYSGLKHQNKNNRKYQVDLLLKYAEEKKAFPTYLFYNYYANYKRWDKIENMAGFPIQYFGCSLCDAKLIRQYMFPDKTSPRRKYVTPKFEDLHPLRAVPIQDGFEFLMTGQGKLACNRGPLMYQELTYHTRDQIYDNNFWIDLAPLPAIGFVPDEDKEKKFLRSLRIKKTLIYNPRFRVIVTRKRRVLSVGYRE